MSKENSEWAKFKQMPLKKKMEHISMYYGWQIVAGLFALICLISVAQQMTYTLRDQLISGIFINNFTSNEGYTFVKEDYITYCGGRNCRAELVENRQLCLVQEEQSQDDDAVEMLLSSMISTQSLDYMITDTATLEFMDALEIILDLSTLENLNLPEDVQVYRSGDRILAVSLQGSAFEQKFTLYKPDSWIFFIANTPERDKCVNFLHYLLNPENY